MGSQVVASFSDLRILSGVRQHEAYTKKQAYGIISDFFVKRADGILTTGDTPDLKAAKSYLAQASKYTVSDAGLTLFNQPQTAPFDQLALRLYVRGDRLRTETVDHFGHAVVPMADLDPTLFGKTVIFDEDGPILTASEKRADGDAKDILAAPFDDRRGGAGCG